MTRTIYNRDHRVFEARNLFFNFHNTRIWTWWKPWCFYISLNNITIKCKHLYSDFGFDTWVLFIYLFGNKGRECKKTHILVSLQARYCCSAYSFLKCLTPQTFYKQKAWKHNILLRFYILVILFSFYQFLQLIEDIHPHTFTK